MSQMERVLPFAAIHAWSNRHELEDVTSFRQGLGAAGLDWEPHQAPIHDIVMDHTGVTYRELDRWKVMRRNDNDAPLGVVGRGYQPFGNRRFAEFMDTLIDTDQAKFAGMGALDGGRRVFAALELAEDQYRQLPGDEGIRPFLYGVNGHDGSSSLHVGVSIIRFACINGMTMVIPGSTFTMKVKHTKNIEYLASVRKKMFVKAAEYVNLYHDTFEELVAVDLDEGFSNLVAQMIPYPKGEVSNRSRDGVDRKRAELGSVWQHSPNLDGVRYTGWGFVNAVAEWDQHGTHPRRSRSGLERMIDGDEGRAIAKARELVMP